MTSRKRMGNSTEPCRMPRQMVKEREVILPTQTCECIPKYHCLMRPVICKSISPLQCITRVNGCCLHINYIVYKHLDRSLHVETSEPTCAQNFRPVPLTVCEILDIVYCEVCCCLHVV